MQHVMRILVASLLMTVMTSAQAPDARPQRPPMTPEQQAEAAKRREAEMNAPRPIAALDSVWMEQLTWMEVRDAIKDYARFAFNVGYRLGRTRMAEKMKAK